jgi:hypothetical protein
MPFPNIPVPQFPNVPFAPGVPQLLRQAGAVQTPSAPPVLPPAQNGVLWQAAQAAPIWGVFDADNNPVLTPDSIIDFSNRQEYRVSDFPVQQGQFASYNKVTLPFEIAIKMTSGGTVDDRAQFLNEVAQVAASTELYTIVTPEKTYLNCNAIHYEVTRRGKDGAYWLDDVEMHFRQIIEVTAQYSTTTVQPTENAQNPAAVPAVNQGQVQPQIPAPATVMLADDTFFNNPAVTDALVGGGPF